jgi:hypothetical protein
MEYKFEIKKSDTPPKHWLIIKREEKTDGFNMTRAELNMLQIQINIYLNESEKE